MAQGHPVVMSNCGNFYLDYPAHSAEKMWFDIRGTNSNYDAPNLLRARLTAGRHKEPSWLDTEARAPSL
jgi:hypothetical protein